MTRLEQIVGEILEQLFDQSEQVETMVHLGLHSLEKKCFETGQQVRQLESLVNRNEIQIEEACIRTLALYQPAASDLRMVATILKVNSDLERIADLALNLTERAEALVDYPSVDVPSELADMVRYSLAMVKDAHQALRCQNTKLAHSVCQRDDQLDAMNRELINTISESMEEQKGAIKGHLHVFSASRIIERIGDHATNIAEDVLYLVEGEIQRHQYKLPDLPGDQEYLRSDDSLSL